MIFVNNEWNENLLKTIKDAMGSTAEVTLYNAEEISRQREKITELESTLKTASENQKESTVCNIEE